MVITSHSSRITLHWKWMASSLSEIVKSWLKCCAYGKELGGGLVAVHWDGGSDVEGVQHIPAEAVPGYWGELLFHSSLRTTATLTSLKPTQMTIQHNIDLSTPKTSQEVVIWLHRHETTFIIGLTSQQCRKIAFFFKLENAICLCKMDECKCHRLLFVYALLKKTHFCFSVWIRTGIESIPLVLRQLVSKKDIIFRYAVVVVAWLGQSAVAHQQQCCRFQGFLLIVR